MKKSAGPLLLLNKRIGNVVRFCALSLCLLATSSVAAKKDEAPPPPKDVLRAPWWDKDWPYRQILRVEHPELATRINTASVTIDTEGHCRPGGIDCRVVDLKGKVVPYAIIKEKDGLVRLKFFVASTESSWFAVYYGNPKASEASKQWKEKIGGLTLETRELTTGGNPGNFGQFMQELQKSKRSFGIGPVENIDQTVNPWSDQQDNYISIYKGVLYCPESGRYKFATNSDDASFFIIDNRLVCEWPGGHVQAEDWGPDYPHAGTMWLSQGLHEIIYYQVETYGSALARAGWKKPSDAKDLPYTTIPPEAFVRFLNTKIVARQRFGQIMNAFFTFDAERAMRINRDACTFTPVRFRDCSSSFKSHVVSWTWDFGDGARSTEQNPLHVFTKKGVFNVRLKALDALGFSDEVVRRVVVQPKEPLRVSLYLEIEHEDNVVAPNVPVVLRPTIQCSNFFPTPFVVRETLSVPRAGRKTTVVSKKETPIEINRKQWWNCERVYPPDYDVMEVNIAVLHENVEVQNQRILIAKADRAPLKLHVHNNNLVDEQGDLVILRIADKKNKAKELKPAGPLHLLLVDDWLAPEGALPDEKTYIAKIRAVLRKRFPALTVHCTRTGHYQSFSEYAPLVRLAEMAADVAARHPDIVVIVPSTEDILNCLPVANYERQLRANLDRIAAHTDAQIVLTTPAPVIGSRDLTFQYALATKRVALKRKLPVADIYTNFLLQGDNWPHLFQAPGLSDPLYYMYPNERGQEIIGNEIARTIIELLHGT